MRLIHALLCLSCSFIVCVSCAPLNERYAGVRQLIEYLRLKYDRKEKWFVLLGLLSKLKAGSCIITQGDETRGNHDHRQLMGCLIGGRF